MSLENKKTYTKEETREIVRKTLAELELELHDELMQLKKEIENENDSLLEAGLKRRKHRLEKDMRIVRNYKKETKQKWLTECCDSPTNSLTKNRKWCSECGESNPETYRQEPDLKNLLQLIKEKENETNNPRRTKRI